jgi:hypothetical protein
MCGLKFMYEASNQTAANPITLKQIMRSQTKAHIAKLSCEIRAIVGYYTVQSGKSFQMFSNLLIPASRVKKSKRED